MKVDKKEFYASKQPIDINSVETNRIAISDKFKHIDKGLKYFFGYAVDDAIRHFVLYCLI